MSKTILADVSGFTPIIDQLAEQYGLMRAAIFGRIWRFCQMEDGVCRASLDTIASGLGIDKATVMRHASELVKDGYLKDLTPDLRNRPHVYADTGKASIKIGIGAAVAQCNTDQKTVAERNATVAPRNTSVAQRNAGVAESQLSKDTKKDQKKDTQETLEATDLSSRIDAHLHTLYNGQYARLNPVIRVDDVFGVITIGVETDAPQLAAQVRTYLKGLKARHKVKVVQTPAVTSGDSQSPSDQLKAALKDEYYQCRGGAVFIDDTVERAALDHLAAQQWTRAMLRAAYEQLNTQWRQDHKVPVTLAAIARFMPGGSHASHQPAHPPVVAQSVIDAINAANRARLHPGV